MSKSKNLQMLETISTMVTEVIDVEIFGGSYPVQPDNPELQRHIDKALHQVLAWFLGALKARDESLRAKDESLRAKDDLLKAKDDSVQSNREENERLVQQAREQSNQVSALIETLAEASPKFSNHKWGTVTRADAWKRLQSGGNVLDSQIPIEESVEKSRLITKFRNINSSSWVEESQMYPEIISAIQSTIYPRTSGIQVVDTSRKGDFRPDISIADYADGRLPYCMRYFIELKLPRSTLVSPEHCGQVIEYIQNAHEKQPCRSGFVGILSNFQEARVFVAQYQGGRLSVTSYHAPTFADAIFYARGESEKQYQKRITAINRRFNPNYTVITLSKQHTLLSVEQPSPASTPVPTTSGRGPAVQTGAKAKASITDPQWLPPSRYKGTKDFVLKIAHDSTVTNEVQILRSLRDAASPHIPELVWAEGNKELGVVPVGTPIDFTQSAHISRKIVYGLLEGLYYLHDRGIVHRDIRPSNLVLDRSNNVIIIDYESAVMGVGPPIEYLGGLICWPKRLLLEDVIEPYTPEPSDDLLACILVVLHLVFPTRFDAFYAGGVQANAPGEQRTAQTTKLLTLWRDIEQSSIWSTFVEAANGRDYDKLKTMADVFCYL